MQKLIASFTAKLAQLREASSAVAATTRAGLIASSTTKVAEFGKASSAFVATTLCRPELVQTTSNLCSRLTLVTIEDLRWADYQVMKTNQALAQDRRRLAQTENDNAKEQESTEELIAYLASIGIAFVNKSIERN